MEKLTGVVAPARPQRPPFQKPKIRAKTGAALRQQYRQEFNKVAEQELAHVVNQRGADLPATRLMIEASDS